MMKKCCICGKHFKGMGNNPDGTLEKVNERYVEKKFSKDEVCCNDCRNIVIMSRLLTLYQQDIKIN